MILKALYQVRKVKEEIHSLFEQNKAEVRQFNAISPAIHFRHAAIDRNKRCVLAYIADRAKRIQAMRWQFGAVLPPEIKANMNEAETQFFSK